MTDKIGNMEEIKGIPEGSIAFPETEKSYTIAKETLCPVCGAVVLKPKNLLIHKLLMA